MVEGQEGRFWDAGYVGALIGMAVSMAMAMAISMEDVNLRT